MPALNAIHNACTKLELLNVNDSSKKKKTVKQVQSNPVITTSVYATPRI